MNTYKVPPARRVRKSRPLDFVYDPIYTLPSRVDFYKSANYASKLGESNLKLRTNYPVIFSDVGTDQRVQACLEMPKRSYINNFLPDYNISGIPVSPMEVGPPCPRHDDVSGADRAKYCIKYAPEIERIESLHLAGLAALDRKRTREKMHEHPFKSRGTQTMCREVETQTDPYSPPYVLPNPHDYPKVLALIKLTWGKGLPVNLEDLVTIERALTRRLLELNDREKPDDISEPKSSEFRKRVRLMEKLEAQQWADREKELEKIRLVKMDVINKQLQELKVKMAKDQTHRLEALFEKKKRDNAKRLQEIKQSYLRQLRKLERKYREGPKKFKRDIILDYVDMESQIYAPLVRLGPNVDQLSVNYTPDYQFTAHHDLETLTYLTDMDSFVEKHIEFDLKGFAARVKKFKPTRSTQMVEKQLEDCFETFKSACGPKEEVAEDEMLSSMIMKSVRRLSTPDDEGVCEEDDEEEEAIVLLQTLIRGRAVQSILRQEADNNMETILQLKSAYETDPFGALQPIGEKLAIRQQQRERELVNNQVSEETELIDQIEGEALVHMMNFLEKEMTRLLDERKIHALILLAERERRMLEASEAGRRQKEEECQRANDEIWREIIGGVHQQTVDMYLEDIYLETVNRTADDGGRKYVQELASTVNSAAYLMEQNLKELDKDEIAADLVHNWASFQVKRENVQRGKADLQGRYYSVATQVTSAVLNSKGLVHCILDTIGPHLEKQLQTGHEAVDASYCAVEQIIHCAVRTALNKEKKKATTGKEAKKQVGKEKEGLAEEQTQNEGEDKEEMLEKDAAQNLKQSPSASDDNSYKARIAISEPSLDGHSEVRSGSGGKEHEKREEGMLDKTIAEGSPSSSQVDVTTSDKQSNQGHENPEQKEEEAEEDVAVEVAEGILQEEEEEEQEQVESKEIEEKPSPIGKDKQQEEKEIKQNHSAAGKSSKIDDRKVSIVATRKDKESVKEIDSQFETIPQVSGAGRREGGENMLEPKPDSDPPVFERFEEKDAWNIPMVIEPALFNLIGLKSMELRQGKEMGETAVKVYDAACVTMLNTFDQVQKCFVSDEEEEDEELDDEPDDEDE